MRKLRVFFLFYFDFYRPRKWLPGHKKKKNSAERLDFLRNAHNLKYYKHRVSLDTGRNCTCMDFIIIIFYGFAIFKHNEPAYGYDNDNDHCWVPPFFERTIIKKYNSGRTVSQRFYHRPVFAVVITIKIMIIIKCSYIIMINRVEIIPRRSVFLGAL